MAQRLNETDDQYRERRRREEQRRRDNPKTNARIKANQRVRYAAGGRERQAAYNTMSVERHPVVEPAEPGDACDVSACGAVAAYRIGWVLDPTVDLPSRWWGYCARHGRRLLPAGHPLRSYP